MTAARDQILGRLRGNLKRTDNTVAEQRLAAKTRGIVPARVKKKHGELVELFVELATAVAATIDRVDDLSNVPDAVADYLAHQNLPSDLCVAPDAALDGVPWDQRPTLTVKRGKSDGSDEVSVTAALAGIAETGTLMLQSGADKPTTLNFLPDNHIVILKTSQIMAAYEDGWDMVRQSGAMPRTVNFVTGPSRTGDIEQTIMMGAHGPRRLHVILVDDGDGGAA